MKHIATELELGETLVRIEATEAANLVLIIVGGETRDAAVMNEDDALDAANDLLARVGPPEEFADYLPDVARVIANVAGVAS